VLLDVVAAVRAHHPELHLVQIGGEWTDEQRRQIERLGIEGAVTQLRGLTRETLASLYRLASVVLQPSEAEGFGLPVVEALACGAEVVASDIPVLREVGGPAVVYCPVADVGQWAETVDQLLREPGSAPSHGVRLTQSGKYSWQEHARIISSTYLNIAAERRV
jgi:glycosyltransferase involved in cell wall biosynthesis